MPDFLLFADVASFFYYWPRQLVAWLVWALIFGGVGLSIAWFRWRKLKDAANQIEAELKRLRAEQNRLRGLIRSPDLK